MNRIRTGCTAVELNILNKIRNGNIHRCAVGSFTKGNGNFIAWILINDTSTFLYSELIVAITSGDCRISTLLNLECNDIISIPTVDDQCPICANCGSNRINVVPAVDCDRTTIFRSDFNLIVTLAGNDISRTVRID